MSSLLRGSVFGNGLGSFRDSMFCQFSGQQKSDSSLDFPGCNGGSLVVVGQSRSLGSNPFKDIVR